MISDRDIKKQSSRRQKGEWLTGIVFPAGSDEDTV